MRASRIMCTLGPASAERVGELGEAGMDVARINLSHGTRRDHEGMLSGARAAAAAAGRPIGVLADLSGPKVRLGPVAGGRVELEEDATFALWPGGEREGDGTGAPVDHRGLGGDLQPGDRVLLSDGIVELLVEEAERDRVITRVLRAGAIRSRAGVNVPAERLSVPAITEKDRVDLAWALGAGVDAVAQSFVRRAEEVRDLRALLGEGGPLLAAKIETRAAVEDADRVARAADVLVVARGDLGTEMPIEEVPAIQRELILVANRAGVPVYVATQMLESMTEAPRPTRAEVADVAGAVFEGADGILLSAETAIGAYPVEATATAGRILAVAERERGSGGPVRPQTAGSDARLVARAAADVCRDGSVAAIACFTRTGLTARLLSAERPTVPVVAFSPEEGVVRQLTLFRGVVPLASESPPHTDAMIAMMDGRLRESGMVSEGDVVVMVASSPVGRARTNLLKVHRLGA